MKQGYPLEKSASPATVVELQLQKYWNEPEKAGLTWPFNLSGSQPSEEDINVT